MPRKKAIIDWDEVGEAAIKGANGQQIAASIGVHYDTLVNRCRIDLPNGFSEFSEFLQQKKQEGNKKLIDTAFDLAVNERDKTLLIFLLKNRAGYSDNPRIETEHQKIIVEHVFPKK